MDRECGRLYCIVQVSPYVPLRLLPNSIASQQAANGTKLKPYLEREPPEL